MAYRIVFRTGPRVERLEAASLDGALTLLEQRARALAAGPRLEPVDLYHRSFQPAQQVAHRAEISGPDGLRAGLDVRGDGSVEAWTGRVKRRVVEQRGSETAYAALRRALAS